MENKWMTNKINLGGGVYKYKCSIDDCPYTRMIHHPKHPEYNLSIYSKYCGYHYKLNFINCN